MGQARILQRSSHPFQAPRTLSPKPKNGFWVPYYRQIWYNRPQNHILILHNGPQNPILIIHKKPQNPILTIAYPLQAPFHELAFFWLFLSASEDGFAARIACNLAYHAAQIRVARGPGIKSGGLFFTPGAYCARNGVLGSMLFVSYICFYVETGSYKI